MRTNPNAIRHNITLNWRSDFCQNKEYGKFIVYRLKYEIWAAKFFKRSQQLNNNGLLYSHTKFCFFNNNHFKLQLYFYDGRIQERLFKLRHTRHKKKRYKLRYKWVKKKNEKKATKKWFRARRYFKFNRKRKKFLFKKYRRRVRTLWSQVFFKKKKKKRNIFKVRIRINRRQRFFSLLNNANMKRWQTLFSIISNNTKKIFKTSSVSVSAFSTQFRGIQATMIARYIVGALVNRFDMVGTVYRLLRGMMMNHFTPGLMIHCSGRFTRRQRKTYKRFQKGKIGAYKFDYTIDYFAIAMRQKYGACGIKVWLAHYIEKNSDSVTDIFQKRIQTIAYRKKKFINYKIFKKEKKVIFWTNYFNFKQFKAIKLNFNQNIKKQFFFKKNI